MEESSSRIDDPVYPSRKDIKPCAFLGVFFCYLDEVSLC